MSFTGRSFLKLLDYTPEEIGALIDLAADLKAKKRPASPTTPCAAKISR